MTSITTTSHPVRATALSRPRAFPAASPLRAATHAPRIPQERSWLERLIDRFRRWLGLPIPTPPAPPVSKPTSPFEAHFTDTYQKSRDANTAIARANLQNPDRKLVALLDSATQSIDAAVYDIEAPVVVDALVRAAARGVQVRLVTDDETAKDKLDHRQEKTAIQRLRAAGVAIVTDDRSAFMHNKFLVVDQQTVWTGSLNWTENCLYRNNNDSIQVTSPKLAENYLAEFEEMFIDRRFGKTSPAGSPHPLVVLGEGIEVETLFAGEDSVRDALLAEISHAQESIRFMAFSFTDDAMGESLLSKAKEGVKVEGVFERVSARSPYGEYRKMKDAGLEVHLDGNDAIMHQKMLLLDAGTERPTLITGSFNFSANADQSNDENVMIIRGDRALVARYLDQFERVRQQALAA